LPRRAGLEEDEWLEIQLQGKWSPLGGELTVSKGILDLEKKGFKRCNMKLYGNMYVVDLSTMKQKNVETQRERPLRRCRGQFKSVLDGGHWGRMPVDSRATVDLDQPPYHGSYSSADGSAKGVGKGKAGAGADGSRHDSEFQMKMEELRRAYPYGSLLSKTLCEDARATSTLQQTSS